MRKLVLPLAILGTTALTAPAFADDHLRIVDDPVELTIHMHWPRAGVQGLANLKTQQVNAAPRCTVASSRRVFG